MENPVPKIYAAMCAIMADVEPIAKSRKNETQKYQFRGIDDVYEALQAILVKHKVFTLPTILEQTREEKINKSGGLNLYSILKIQYTFYSGEDGSSVTASVIGEGMDNGDKSSNKAMSVGHKYTLLQAFAIPTKEPKDPENDSHDLDGSKNAKKEGEFANNHEPITAGSYVVKFGKYKGMAIRNIDVCELENYVDYITTKAAKEAKPIIGDVADFLDSVDIYLSQMEH